MNSPDEICVLVLLHAGHEGLDALRRFESKALKTVEAHGGQLVTAFRPEPELGSEPDEIHLLKFPSTAHFERFKNDPRHQQLRAERNSAIAATEVLVSRELVQYSG